MKTLSFSPAPVSAMGYSTRPAAKLRRSKEGLQALVTQDRIDLRAAWPPVRARVADEHVVGIVRHVGPVPTNPVVGSLLAETRGRLAGSCARLRPARGPLANAGL